MCYSHSGEAIKSPALFSISTGQAMTEIALRKTRSSFSDLVVKVRSSMETNNIKVKDVRQFLVTYFEGECDIPEGGDLTKLDI